MKLNFLYEGKVAPYIWASVIVGAIYLRNWLVRVNSLEIKNTVFWEPSDQSLPMKHSIKGHMASGFVWLIFIPIGVSLLLCVIFMTLLLFFGSDPLDEYFVLSLVSYLGITIALGCILFFILNHFFIRGKTEINRHFVIYQYRDIIRNVSWTEPLSSYSGIFFRIINHRLRMTWEIELKHLDPSKSIILFSPSMPFDREFRRREVRNKLEHYSQLLGVRVLNWNPIEDDR